ncbi:hypothetical protein [Thermococcus sp.]
MAESYLKRKLAESIASLWEEISEIAGYGIPHLVGEIHSDGKVELSAVVFNDYRLETFVDDGVLHFIFPAEEGSPRALFLSLWFFLTGKSAPKFLRPGERFRGQLPTLLKRMGFEVLWMAGDSYVEVWAAKNGVRYHLTFKKIGDDEYILAEKERVQ